MKRMRSRSTSSCFLLVAPSHREVQSFVRSLSLHLRSHLCVLFDEPMTMFIFQPIWVGKRRGGSKWALAVVAQAHISLFVRLLRNSSIFKRIVVYGRSAPRGRSFRTCFNSFEVFYKFHIPLSRGTKHHSRNLSYYTPFSRRPPKVVRSGLHIPVLCTTKLQPML